MPQEPQTGEGRYLVIWLGTVVTLLILALGVLFAYQVISQHNTYSALMTHAGVQAPTDFALTLTLARALDAAFHRTSALLLAYLLVFTGALYVLRASEVRFASTVETGGAKTTLDSNSPGLVMVALGVLVVGLVLYAKSDITYEQRERPIAPHSFDKDTLIGALSKPSELIGGPAK